MSQPLAIPTINFKESPSVTHAKQHLPQDPSSPDLDKSDPRGRRPKKTRRSLYRDDAACFRTVRQLQRAHAVILEYDKATGGLMAKAKSAGTTMTARELVRDYIERLHALLGFKVGFFARQAMVPFGESDDPAQRRRLAPLGGRSFGTSLGPGRASVKATSADCVNRSRSTTTLDAPHLPNARVMG